jgi:hypothetical protein
MELTTVTLLTTVEGDTRLYSTRTREYNCSPVSRQYPWLCLERNVCFKHASLLSMVLPCPLGRWGKPPSSVLP